MHAPTPWSAVPVTWRHAAIAVAQLECEPAEVSTRGTTPWRDVESAVLLRLTVAVRAFPAAFLAILMGMTQDIDEDEYHSVWIGVDGDAEHPGWTAQVVPAPGESLMDCIRGFRRIDTASRHWSAAGRLLIQCSRGVLTRKIFVTTLSAEEIKFLHCARAQLRYGRGAPALLILRGECYRPDPAPPRQARK